MKKIAKKVAAKKRCVKGSKLKHCLKKHAKKPAPKKRKPRASRGGGLARLSDVQSNESLVALTEPVQGLAAPGGESWLQPSTWSNRRKWIVGGGLAAGVLFLMSRTKRGQQVTEKAVTTVAEGAKTVAETVKNTVAGVLSMSQLRAAMPKMSSATALRMLAPLNAALEWAEITTPSRIAAFLAQVAHESGSLSVFEENLNYSADALLKTFPKYFNATTAAQFARKPEKIANRVYSNRMGNGPESSGDGWRYRGRGAIQLTGKANYAAFAAAVGVDVLKNPDLVAQPDLALKSAAWFWRNNKLNALADKGDFYNITQVINGGQNGREDREARYAVAKQALVA